MTRYPPALLRLPPHLRRRVYLHAGLARDEGHPYTYYLDGRKESPPRHFTGLLLCCRALYAEAAALLYSANCFVISYSCQGSLEPLRALSPTALASLTSLKIVLKESSCHHPTDSIDHPPFCCCVGREDEPAAASYHCARYHSSLHRCPLLDSGGGLDSASTKLAAQAILTEWHDTACHLSSHVGLGRLELSLVCDIDVRHNDALETARLIVAPLALFQGRPLRNCHIRLCKQWNRPLQRLAQDAVLQACPNISSLRLEPARVSTPLLNLPRELRLRILEYTDLITPWKEVTWSRQDHGYQLCHALCLDPLGGCPPHIHHGCRLSRCSSGVDEPDPSALSPGCFCRRRHAAFSFSCRCWAPPTSLFLICQTVYREAQFVFFSGNRFVVHDFHATQPWHLPSIQLEPENTDGSKESYPYKRFAASEFLRDVVPTRCLTNLRFLELVFPPYVPHGWPLDEHTAVLDWRATVEWIRAKINAPALTIRVVMADCSEGRQALTEDQGHRILGGYRRILRPLKCLARDSDDSGLAALYVQPAHPWRWTLETRGRIQRQGRHWLAEEEQELREECEHVPGRDVGLALRNTCEPEKSVWQRWYDADYF